MTAWLLWLACTLTTASLLCPAEPLTRGLLSVSLTVAGLLDELFSRWTRMARHE